ncbi:Rieske (2Fe-2S) protein [Candidatus Woesearchaeota archaeon]|nr:Rieske (2Fe-2S) protein [Candidatus Woesearchaeota archaeon]
MALVKVAKKADISPGTGKTVVANGKEIALFNIGGNFYALSNKCVHKGGPLGEGELDNSTVTCPWHGWEYDVKTGQCLTMPVSVETYPVKVEEEDVMVEV